MQPILKWPGGKRWMTAGHAALFPAEYHRYIEPFLGSAAVFFHLKPPLATLGDINADLIAVYKSLRSNWQDILAQLQRHQQAHSTAYYYSIRQKEPTDEVERAARLIYLNRTCFNGIYRVNRQGQFNVPKGTKTSVLFPTDDFESTARLLRKAEIKQADFAVLINDSVRGDFVFADPPYTVRHNSNAFVKYNETLFSWSDQERLADALQRARGRGVKIVATNANHDSVRDLYRSRGFVLRTVSRFSSISAASASRKQYEELVILGNVEAPQR